MSNQDFLLVDSEQRFHFIFMIKHFHSFESTLRENPPSGPFSEGSLYPSFVFTFPCTEAFSRHFRANRFVSNIFFDHRNSSPEDASGSEVGMSHPSGQEGGTGAGVSILYNRFNAWSFRRSAFKSFTLLASFRVDDRLANSWERGVGTISSAFPRPSLLFKRIRLLLSLCRFLEL